MKSVTIRLRNIPDHVDGEKVREYVEATVRKFVKGYPAQTPPEVAADQVPNLADGGYIPQPYTPWIPRTPGVMPMPYTPTWTTNSTGSTSRTARSHPFEGPEVNDDLPIQGENIIGLVDGDLFKAIGEDFPFLRDVFRAKGAPQPPAEGDWQLEDDDKAGKD